MTEIVVGIDGSPCSVRALEWAVEEARLRDSSVRAVMSWAQEGRPVVVDETTPSHSRKDLAATAARLLHETVAPVRVLNPTVKIIEHVVNRDPVTALVEDAEYACMLVVGARGLGPVRRMLVGSVSAGCAQEADVPVIVIRPPREPAGADGPAAPVRPVVVGIDGSDASLVALVWAAEEAALRSAPLQVVHAWGVPASMYAAGYYAPPEAEMRDAAQAVLDDAVAEALGPDSGVTFTSALVVDHSAHALVEAAADAALLVVGARGHGGLLGLSLGSTSHQCVVHAHCPVAVIRTPVQHGSIL